MKEKISKELNKIIEKIKENSQPEYNIEMVCKKGEKQNYISIEGSEASCLTALCRFINALKEAGVAQESIDYAINLTKMSDEELEEKNKGQDEEIIDKIKEIIEKLDD